MSTDSHSLKPRGDDSLDAPMLIPRGESSFVWSRSTGDRVIIIIDDDYDQVGVENPFPARSPHAFGLYAVFAYMNQQPGTRAVGYFFMPDKDWQVLFSDIQEWLDEVGGAPQLYVLVDVYFGPHAEETAFGVNVLKYFKPRLPNAKFSPLSTAGYIPDPDNPEMPLDAFSKGDVEAVYRRTKKLPEDLLEFFDLINPPQKASTIDVATWQRLRRAALHQCRLIGTSETLEPEKQPGHPWWAHHLPYGGETWVGTLVDESKAWTERLRNELLNVTPVTANLPNYAWEVETVKGAQAWERPPVRALAQFDSGGRDLSAAFYLLKKDVRLITQNEVTIRFGSTLTMHPASLRKDYLWFNVSALAHGLFLLAQCFKGEVIKAGRAEERLPMGLNLPCVGGRLFWHVTELDEPQEKGLQLCIYQYLLGWNREQDERFPCFERVKYGFPDEGSARGRLQTAYQHFKRSGATIKVQDQNLILTVHAAEVRDADNPNITYWEVKEP